MVHYCLNHNTPFPLLINKPPRKPMWFDPCPHKPSLYPTHPRSHPNLLGGVQTHGNSSRLCLGGMTHEMGYCMELNKSASRGLFSELGYGNLGLFCIGENVLIHQKWAWTNGGSTQSEVQHRKWDVDLTNSGISVANEGSCISGL